MCTSVAAVSRSLTLSRRFDRIQGREAAFTFAGLPSGCQVTTDGLLFLQCMRRTAAIFSKLLSAAGITGARFHDLRHTYAVNAIRAGDDIKTVQGNLGHATAAFTLDRYGHFTERMKQDSADRMDRFIEGVLNL